MCRAHATVRGLLGEIMEKSVTGRDVVVDMEAGLEHLSRGTVRHVDRLLVVMEPYFRSLETGRRTAELAAELGIPRIEAVANKLRDPDDEAALRAYCRTHGIEVAAEIPWDDALRDAERAGRAPLDFDPTAPAIGAIRGLVE
jgi:CO dehydrogenase maturation factor